jgi:hypothetical protein
MTTALVYVTDGNLGPGRLTQADLDVVAAGPTELVLPEVTVRDERGGYLMGDDLCFDPCYGGGPLCHEALDRQARAFGIVNAAYHAQRAMRLANTAMGVSLPSLLVRIGAHERRRWGGGHYRLPNPASLEECGLVDRAGEVHLGGGASFVTWAGRPYFHAPAHNAAIVYHEVGHHVCRHTADFRLNRLRDPQHQTNRKVALDEGTADYLTAALAGSPDIYGWHRQHIPESDQRRRRLDPQWTMMWFRGGRNDPHADGTVWASALWSARQAVACAAAGPRRMDVMLLQGLLRLGQDLPDRIDELHLRRRRYFSGLLEAIAASDPALGPVVLQAMARHGIEPGASNAVLRERDLDRATNSSRPDSVRPWV